MRKILTLLTITLFSSGCSSVITPPNTDPFGNGSTQKAILSKANFNLDILRFEDQRSNQRNAFDTTDDVLYAYNPDTLMSGVSMRLPVLFSKHLGTSKKTNAVVLTELTLRHLSAKIKTGTLSTGAMGRYLAEIEIDVTARDVDSSALLTETYVEQVELRRRSYDGRPPSTEMDRSRMYQTVEEAVRRIATRIAKDVTPAYNKAQKQRKKALRAQ